MSAQDNGGQAFPSYRAEGGSAPGGMTLRDYFAAQALAGALAQRDSWPKFGDQKQGLAMECYAIADAMLAERSKR